MKATFKIFATVLLLVIIGSLVLGIVENVKEGGLLSSSVFMGVGIVIGILVVRALVGSKQTDELLETDQELEQEPGTLRQMPESDETVPQTDEQEPGTLRQMPESDETVPQTDEQEPGTLRQMPETDETVPQTGEQEPGTLRQMPETDETVPQTGEQEPGTLRQMPETDETVPQTDEPTGLFPGGRPLPSNHF